MKLLQGPCCFEQRRCNLLGRHRRLMQIINDSDADSFFYIRKVLKAAEEDNLHTGVLFLDSARQLQAIHARHADIRHHNVNLLPGQHLKRLMPVRSLGFPGNGKLIPIQHIAQPQPHNGLILHYKQIPHASFLHSRPGRISVFRLIRQI